MSQRPAFVRHTARLKPLAELVDRCLEPALAAQGFAAADVILAWPEIVGERLARHTEPLRIVWPKRAIARNAAQAPAAQAAVLVVRVSGAFALELQHMAPVVVERVNTHFGWRCIGRLALQQGPIERRQPRPRPERSLDPLKAQVVSDAVSDIADERLREALLRLGNAVMAKPADG